jgi:hypothetical protein
MNIKNAVAAVLLLSSGVLFAQQTAAPPRAAAASALPTPASVLGFDPGADFKLANYEQTVAYFKKLDAASDKMMMFEAGKSSQGRTFAFAAISSARNLANIERYRQIAQRLAHPAGLTDAEAKRLSAEGKAFVHIDGGLHATEVAGPQHTPKLAYDILRRANEPEMARILDNVILLLWPTINPDGQSMVADHYMKTLAETGTGTSYPALYQDYVGHDNNRDAYMMNMIESRVMEHAWRQWEPQIIYVHHQTSPFPTRIWLPPFADPIAIEAPPMISRQLNMIGMAIARKLEENGQPGATHMGSGFDAWYPGYIDYNPVFKNIAAFWTETSGAGLANIGKYTLNSIPAPMRDFRPDPLYASPWKPRDWHLADSVGYMETASLATLDFAARYKEEVLWDRYLAGRDQIKRGESEGPFAYFIPRQQRDPVLAVELLRRLAFSGVKVYELTAPAATFDTGTWVIPTDQEFAAAAREVLDVQKYPDLRDFAGGPPEQPYDASGWTLPMSMDVNVVAATTPLPADVRSKMKLVGPATQAAGKPTAYPTVAVDPAPWDSVPGIGFDVNPMAAAIKPANGRITGSGQALSIDAAQINVIRAAHDAWRNGGTVRFVAGSSSSPAKYQIVGLNDAAQAALVRDFAIQAERSAVAGVEIKKPRVALVNGANSMDSGWTRWVFDTYGVPFTAITPADVTSDPLKNRFDVIVVTSEGGAFFGGAAGGRGGRGGAASAPAGASASQAETDRVKVIDDFVRAGGVILCFNASSNQAIAQLKLPVTNVASGKTRQEFFLNGSLLEVTTDRVHQVMAGMPDKAAIFTDNSPAFQTGEGFKGAVLAKYKDEGSPLLSGYLLGEKIINGKAAALDVELGSGHVILLGFRPQWRGQPFSTFRVIFNSLLLAR